MEQLIAVAGYVSRIKQFDQSLLRPPGFFLQQMNEN